MRLSLRQFEALVGGVLDELPPLFARALDNIVVRVRPWPSRHDLDAAGLEDGSLLLGLYHGIPLTERTGDYQMVAPDVISIYQGPIEQVTDGSAAAIRREIRITVLHEIAHYFGIDDDRLHELGAY